MTAKPTLLDITQATDFASRVSGTVERVAQAPDEQEACALLGQAVRHFGADAAAFASFIRDDDSYESYRFLLACDPRWCDEYLEEAWFASDDEGPIPSVGYAWLAALRRIAAVDDAEGPLTAPIDGWFPYDAGALPRA